MQVFVLLILNAGIFSVVGMGGDSHLENATGSEISQFVPSSHLYNLPMAINRLPRDLSCFECNILFDTESELITHIESHGYSGYCGLCRKVFRSKTGYNYHVQQMHNQYSISCDVCGKVVPSQSHLKRHKLSHTKVHPHCCSICGKGYKHRFDMLRHERACVAERDRNKEELNLF